MGSHLRGGFPSCPSCEARGGTEEAGSSLPEPHCELIAFIIAERVGGESSLRAHAEALRAERWSHGKVIILE